MLYDEKAVRDNIRNREGRRVFILGNRDTLTPSARDFLNRERIAILPPEEAKPQVWKLLNGGYCENKPEAMTHLNGDTLVPKNHPRIRFRGAVDTLEAELLLCGSAAGEVLTLVRRLIRCDVLNEPVGDTTLYGLTEAEQRKRSHFPQDYYGIPHFMPDFSDSPKLLQLNRARCAARSAELAAVDAFVSSDGIPTRADILQAMNRISSMLYLLMLQEKSTKD